MLSLGPSAGAGKACMQRVVSDVDGCTELTSCYVRVRGARAALTLDNESAAAQPAVWGVELGLYM